MSAEPFCSVCGKKSDRLKDSLCPSCFAEENVRIGIPEALEVKVCEKCLANLYHGEWYKQKTDLEEAIIEGAYEILEDSIEVEGLKDSRIGLEAKRPHKSSDKVYYVSVDIHLEGKIGDRPYKKTLSKRVRVVLTLCRECQRRKSRYFEATVQIRGEEPLTRMEREKIKEIVERFMKGHRKERNAFITEFKEIKAGLDFVMGSKRIGYKLVKELQKEFGGELKKSSTLVGKKDGEDLTRITYSLRLPGFKKGDIVKLAKKVFQVLKISGNVITLFDLDSREPSRQNIQKLKNAEILGRKKDYRKAIVTESIPGRVQLLELQEYKTFYLNTNLSLKVQEELEIFIGDREYILKKPHEKG